MSRKSKPVYNTINFSPYNKFGSDILDFKYTFAGGYAQVQEHGVWRH